MAIRISGMYSGFDTDSMVKELSSAYSIKKDNLQKQKTALEWKKDQWTDLNKEIYSFYSSTLSDIRFGNENGYRTKYNDDKVISIDNPNKNNVGTYNFQVEQLAQSGYLTGKELDSNVNKDTKISSIIEHPRPGNTISVNNKIIKITKDMTIGELAEEISKATNVHANYDSKNHRFFINATQVGANYDFDIKAEDEGGQDILNQLGLTTAGGATRIDGQDAIMTFNGIQYTSHNNNFEINGLKITAKSVSSNPVNATIEEEPEQTFDIISKFINSYNELLVKMQTAYNKPSNKLYMPLTDQEKEVLSDKEIEKWEATGKENILSKDQSLNTLISLFKGSALKTYNINGKKVSLSSIGIETGAYFSSDKDHRGTLNIDEKKLKEKLKDEPDLVNNLIKAVTSDLYDALSNNSKSSSVRSVYKFYNDKELNKNINDYQKNIDKWEQKIIKIEDKYYRQFSAMEKALSKMQSQSTAFTNMFDF